MLLVVGLLLNTRTAFSLRYLNNIANVNLSDVLPSIEDGQVQLLTTYYGHYPIIESETGQWCNGGLPQLANITAHKLKAASDIRKRIAPGASVFGVFDYENWRLHWNTTSDIYRLNSILLANYTTPGLPPDELLAKAKKDFETAGLKFFLATVHQANELFPESRFGFYSYPNIGFWRSDAQVAHLQQLNNRLLPLWQASTALFPSVYLPYKSNVDAAYALNQLYLDRTIGEGLRVAKLAGQSGGGSSPPVYPYTWHRYHDGEPHGLQLLDDLDFHLEFASAHNYTDNSNFAGLVLWGSEGNATGVNNTRAIFARHADIFKTRKRAYSVARHPVEDTQSIPSDHVYLQTRADAANDHDILRKAMELSANGWTPPPFTFCTL